MFLFYTTSRHPVPAPTIANMPSQSPTPKSLSNASHGGQQPDQSAPVFDYFILNRFCDIENKRTDIPLILPSSKRAKAMAHTDYIAHALQRDIQEYRKLSFDNFAVDVRIHPIPSAFEFYDLKGKWIGFNKYAFDSHGSEPKAMSVTVDREWNIKIKYLGKWRHVSDYLENLRPHNAWDDSMSKTDIMHLQWRQQADWWRENGKVFPLMDLPAEVRESVYEHVWGPVVEPYPTNSSRKLTALGKISRKLRMPNCKLLQTSSQVAAEASNILFLRTPFYIEHYGVLKALTSNIYQRVLIRRLDLAFSHEDFLHLFSTDHIRRDKKTKTEVVGFGYPALVLRSMKLNSLRLVIAPPSLTTKSGIFDGACQRVAVDMIMEAAWPIIRGHPLVLDGYVKDLQQKAYQARDVLERERVHAWQKKRKAWGLEEGSLAEYDEELDAEVGGVPLNGSTPEFAQEQVSEPEQNLVCHCDPPCTEEQWTPWS